MTLKPVYKENLHRITTTKHFANPFHFRIVPLKHLHRLKRCLSRKFAATFSSSDSALPPSSSAGQYVSMQELYKNNFISTIDDSATTSDSSTGKSSVGLAAGGSLSYNSIRETLSHLKPNQNEETLGRTSLARYKESLKQKPDPNANLGSTKIIGGSMKEKTFGTF